MTVETHDVVFSFDQPGDARHPLLVTLQQVLHRPLPRDSKAATLLGFQRVLIVDSQQERANYLAQLLSRFSYKSSIVPNSLDAFTLFLQGTLHPFAIILSEAGPANNQFFLTRLSQQFMQRYDWNVPFIRLQIPASSSLFPRTTAPLLRPQSLMPPPSSVSLPLEHTPLPPNPATTRALPPSSSSQLLIPAPAPTEQSLKLPAAQRSSDPLHAIPSTSLQTDPPRPLLPAPRSGGVSGLPTPITEIPTTPNPLIRRQVISLPSASTMKFTKKQVEKISLDGLSIGRYQLESVIGGNPIGDVYLTYDRLREQNIALKTIQTNMIPFHLMEELEEDYNLFQQELDLLRQIEHPHLARVMNIGKSYISGFPFIYKTMPYYAEGSLASWLHQFNGQLFTSAEVARVVMQVANAVQALHERHLLYQNFKLANILVVNQTRNMRDLQVVLSDLPFVQDVINLPKQSESYRYIAPEQWDGVGFPASDQYGLAAVAYELLTGRAPFQGNSDTIMRRMHVTMPPPAPSSVNRIISPLIDQVILRALSKRPEGRFASVADFAATFERASD